MKRLIVIIMILVLCFLIVACSSNKDEKFTSKQTEVTQNPTSDPSTPSSSELSSDTNVDDEKVTLKSDPFPKEWIGSWICSTSENMPIEEGEIVEFLDYENKIKITVDSERTDNWWGYYDADANIFQMYLDKNFVEDEYIYQWDISKQNDTQIIFSDQIMGFELVLEKQ